MSKLHSSDWFWSHQSLRWPSAMGWHLMSCINKFSRTGPIFTKFGYSICKIKRQEIVFFFYPSLQGEIILGVKLMYLFKRLLLYSWAQNRQNWEYSNGDQGRVYQNCKFHDLWDRGPCARTWLCHKMKIGKDNRVEG